MCSICSTYASCVANQCCFRSVVAWLLLLGRGCCSTEADILPNEPCVVELPLDLRITKVLHRAPALSLRFLLRLLTPLHPAGLAW